VPVMVEFTNGLRLVTPMTLEEMHEAFQKAMSRNTLFDVKDDEGRTLSVNPVQVISFREIDDATAERLKTSARHREPATA
jgi:hypothetical protein